MPHKVSPSLNYWREVDELDKRLYTLAEPAGHHKWGIVKVSDFRNVWRAEEPDQFSFWKGTRFPGGIRPLAQLILGEAVETDTFTTGFFGDVYKYSCGLRKLYITAAMVPDVHDHADDEEPDALAQRLNEQIGADAITSERYDTLIAELRRGASGDYAIPYPRASEE